MLRIVCCRWRMPGKVAPREQAATGGYALCRAAATQLANACRAARFSAVTTLWKTVVWRPYVWIDRADFRDVGAWYGGGLCRYRAVA
jgi:hypothetical protein